MVVLDEGEYDRWMRSSRRTIESSKRDLKSGDYNWACFKAHQSVEKALKALLWGIGRPSYGHSLTRLVEEISESGIAVDERIRELAARLSKFHTPTRYPDVWDSGIPEDYYTEGEAMESIEWAEEIIEWVGSKWRSLRGG